MKLNKIIICLILFIGFSSMSYAQMKQSLNPVTTQPKKQALVKTVVEKEIVKEALNSKEDDRPKKESLHSKEDGSKKETLHGKTEVADKKCEDAKVEDFQGMVVSLNDYVMTGSTELTKEKAAELTADGQPIVLLVGEGDEAKIYFVCGKECNYTGSQLAELAGDNPVKVTGTPVNNLGINCICDCTAEACK